MRAHRRARRRAARVEEHFLPCEGESASAARLLTAAFLSRSVAGHGADLLDASVVVSELVTNAARHGHGYCRLRLYAKAGSLTVAVHDDSPLRPRLRPSSATAESGRGLAIVDALSRHLAVIGDAGGGKTVRAVLAAV